jgi:hypothetical protein
MTANQPDIARIRHALSEISRERLPSWLASVLDTIESNVASLPPPRKADDNVPEYLYPH